MVDDEWTIRFNRSFDESDLESWYSLLDELHQVSLDEQGGRDEIAWTLEKSGTFTSRSLCKFITYGGVVAKIDSYNWDSKLPMKIKIFPWQIHHRKAAAMLKRRG